MENNIEQMKRLLSSSKPLSNSKKTICFATMCKNEELCIKDTLESVAPFIDYWVVCDTGSTDSTCEIVTNFFKEKNIPGKLLHHEWVNFPINKSKMYEECFNTSDYVLHLDADDHMKGNFKELFDNLHSHPDNDADIFYFNNKRGTLNWKATVFYNNRLRWELYSVAHTIIKCLDKDNIKYSDYFMEDSVWIDAEERGVRKFDPNKYVNDANKLKDQFFETLHYDPHGLNTRSVFYAAQSYMDCRNYEESLKWYSLYTRLNNTWIEELYESYMRIGKCLFNLKKDYKEVENYMQKAINLFPDRAEAYYWLGLYSNHYHKREEAYKLFKEALTKDYEQIKKKYSLFLCEKLYGKYIYDELSVACYWLKKYEEGKEYVLKIINDPDFEMQKERLQQNLNFLNNELNK